MFNVLTIDVYNLVDLSVTLFFVTPIASKKFEISLDILREPFLVSTPVGESVIAKRVYKNCPIMLPNRDSYVELA